MPAYFSRTDRRRPAKDAALPEVALTKTKQQGVLTMRIHRFGAAVVAALVIVGAAVLPAAAQGIRPAGAGGLPPVTAAAPAPRPAAAGTSVAVIDLQEVFDNHRRFKMAMDAINKETEQLNAQFRTEQKELQKMMEKLKELKPGTPDYKRQEEAAAQFESNLRVQAQLQRKEVAERQAKQLYQTYEEVLAAVKSFSNRNGIALVIQFSADEIEPANPQSIMRGVNRAVVYQHQLNITEFIIEIVNQGTAPEPKPQGEGNISRGGGTIVPGGPRR
jgi:Skp family chaperone for outer membrane proteins